MSKDTPKAPEAPDPTKVANANANANRYNINTPFGNQVWKKTGVNPDGTDKWEQDVTLDPAQQELLDRSNQLSLKQMGNVENSVNNPPDFNGLQPLKYGVDVDGKPTFAIDQTGTEDLTRNVDSSGIQRQLKVPQEQLYAAMQNAQKAAYGMQTQYLDPQYQQAQHDLENKLTQQGVLQNSDAWNRAIEEQGRQKTFDYNNAFNNSFATGLAANNQLFNQDLSSGQFVNAAQGQQFNEGMANANLNNSAANQLYGQRMGSANLNNATLDTQFKDRLANAQFNNQAHAQQLTDMLTQQNNPINVLSALRNGTQINAPNFGSGGNSPTDMAALYNNVYNGQLSNYNSQIAQNNALTGGLFNLGAAGIMAPAGTFSWLK